MGYDLYPAVDQNFEFPPEVQEALAKSVYLRNTVTPMTEQDKDNLPIQELWDGRVIANLTTDRLERYDGGTISWSEIAELSYVLGLLADKVSKAGDSMQGPLALPGDPVQDLEAAPKQYVDMAAGSGVPIGIISPWAGIGSPDGWLACDGAEVSRIEYADLFAVCDTVYGVGNGLTTFNVPDLRGCTVVSWGAGSFSGARGTKLGEESHILTEAELAWHGHGVSDPGHAHGVADPTHNHNMGNSVQWPAYSGTEGWGGWGAQQPSIQSWYTTGGSYTGIGIHGAGAGISIAGAGGNVPHNNIQPSMVLQYIIKT